jgi:GST-like protein
MAENYVPPRIWNWDKPSGGSLFGSLNRPISGATHDKELPRGQHPFQLYSLGTPNGQKVTILLEELLAAGHAGAEYDAWYVSIMDGDQFGSGYVAVNPNSKIPALLDCSGPQPVRVFESGAIMLHLAEKFAAFVPPAGSPARAECLSWLFWQMSTAPMIGGGFGHFYFYAPEKVEYAINRFAMETKRIFDVADRRLAEARYLAGDTYTIADMAVYGWLGYFHRGEAYNGDDGTDGTAFLDFASYRNVDRWCRELGERPGLRRGIKVNREGEGYVRDRHSAADIDAVM